MQDRWINSVFLLRVDGSEARRVQECGRLGSDTPTDLSHQSQSIVPSKSPS